MRFAIFAIKIRFFLVRYGSRFPLCNEKRFLLLCDLSRAFCIKTENGYFPRTILIALLVKNGKYLPFLTVRFAVLAIKAENDTVRYDTIRYSTVRYGDKFGSTLIANSFY